MRGKLFQLGVSLVVAAFFMGCKTPTPLKDKDHPDPLCVTKKPIEGRATDAEPEATVRIDPPPPPIPSLQPGTVVRQRAPLGTPQPVNAGLE